MMAGACVLREKGKSVVSALEQMKSHSVYSHRRSSEEARINNSGRWYHLQRR
jgi:hypothetical protein